MDKITKLAAVNARNCRYVCEVPPRADLSAGDSVIYKFMGEQHIGEVVNVIELTGAVGTAVADFIADLTYIPRPFSRIVGAVELFDWSSEAVDDGGDDGDNADADESADAADTAEPAPAPERDHGADVANSMDTGGANPIYRKQPCAYAHTCMYAKTCGMPDKCTHRDTADGIGNATVVPDGYKRCDTCRQVKPLSYFVRGNGADGKGDTCMKCARARNREAREALDEFNRNGGNTR